MNRMSQVTKQGVQFGVSLLPHGAGEIEVARAADAAGLDFALFVDSQLLWPEVYTIMTAAVLQTRHLKIGPGVTNPVTRHPAVAASAMASIDELGGGNRTVFGVGRGDSALRSMGLEVATNAALRQYVQTCRSLFRGETARWGEPGEFKLHWSRPRDVPIIMVASGPRTLELAGEIADCVCMLVGCRPDLARWALEHVRRGAERAGRSLADLDIGLWVHFFITDDPMQAHEEARGGVAAQLNLWKQAKGLQIDELPADIAAQLRDRTANYNYRNHLSADARHALDLPEAVVQAGAVAGSVDHCRQRLRELVDVGLDSVYLVLLSVREQEERLRVIRTFSDKILPDFRQSTGVKELADESPRTASGSVSPANRHA